MDSLPPAAIAAIVAEIEPSAAVVGASVMSGGLSSWMTLVEIEFPDRGRHRLVVRRGRRSDAERHTLPLTVEYELLRHLRAHGIPVARPRMFDDSGSILEQAYLVYDHVAGATAFAVDDPIAVGERMGEVLAGIHALDVADPSLPSLPSQVDRMEGWVITGLTRRPPDPSLREDLVRQHLEPRWPPPEAERCLLHADFFPGNLVWDGDGIAAVIDWEAAAIGDPMSDVATTRLDLRWAYGAEVAEAFTQRYQAVTSRSPATLPVWELVVALRPAGTISLWAADMVAHGRPDITAASMRVDHHAFVDDAIARLD